MVDCSTYLIECYHYVSMRDMRDKFGLCSGCWPCDVRPCSSHVQIRISSLALY